MFEFIEVRFEELKEEVNVYIQDLYNKSDVNLSPADPYGQLLQAIEMIFHSALLYLKNVTAQFDINNPENNNAKMVRALARVAGYNPSRAISATGGLSLQLKPSVDFQSEITGSKISVLNGTKLTNKTNNLEYFIDLGTDRITYQLEANKKYLLPIVQGRIETQTFTGTGTQNQSFSINLPSSQSVEQFRVSVRVNSQLWNVKEHLFDMLPNERSYYMRTGIENGLDLYFGTSNFGSVPNIGDEIEVRYVVSNGSLGNIPHRMVNDFTFVDDIFDDVGLTVDVERNFNIFIENEISLGGDSETVEFTKAVLPYTSRNFVLARPEQYQFLLSRLNVFSQIDAFTTEKGSDNDNGDVSDDGVVYLFLIPNIDLFITGGNSYFDLDIRAFFLEDSEKVKVSSYLRTQGTLCVGTSLKILDPIINKYVVNITLRIFDNAIEDNIRNEVLSVLSNYFAKLKRDGRIDKSSVISLIDAIVGVDSVNIDFLSQANEEYHGEYIRYKESVMMENPNINPDLIILEGYQPNRLIGLDQLGDIIYTKNELPIIRGGFHTRDGIFINETPSNGGINSVNINIDRNRSKRTIF